MYCEIADLKSIIPEKELINLSNDSVSTTINEEIINTCGSYADELINASLRNKYSLPLSYIPNLIKQIASDITAYRLYSRRPREIPDHIKKNCDDAQKILLNIQKGITVLDLPSEHKEIENIQSSANPYLTNKTRGDRKFNDSMWSHYAS